RWDVWGRAYLDGTALGAPLGPFTVHVDPGQDTTFVFEQPVPEGAPPGDYTYTVSLGRHPDPLAGESSFPFTKAQPTASAPVPNAAALTLSAAPNPVPGRATLAFSLPTPSPTPLVLFDAL